MGRTYDRIDDRLAAFVSAQPVFFVATAPLSGDGRLNLSPKGLEGTFAVLDPHRVAYLDLTGSGVETIAHLRENGRIVLMFCAFGGKARIVRLHGTGTVHLRDSPRFEELTPLFAAVPGGRAVIEVTVGRIADSCGWGVPRMDYAGDRDELVSWAESKGQHGLEAYRDEKNVTSLDGLPGIVQSR